ncbi:MAG: DUF4235 domain-containing protein [Dermabacter sp.]|nr:DUF4235 domain-containing protein [Dermabacter sp.]
MAAPVNPLVKVAMTAASIAAGIIGNRLLKAGWQAAFHEDAPDKKTQKESEKSLRERQKLARKEGYSKADVAQMSSEYERIPAWRIALWTILSGTVIAGIQTLARQGTKEGAERLVMRRPRPNRG